MAQTGFNYYYQSLQLNTGDYLVHYDFNATGNIVISTQGANSIYSGTFPISMPNFWSASSAGLFGTGCVEISHAHDMVSDNWTHIFVYDKNSKNAGILFNSQHGSGICSGYSIGITSNNKLYFESQTAVGTQVKVSSNIFAKKNAVAITKTNNKLTFNYYNFDNHEIEAESFPLEYFIPNFQEASIGGAVNAPNYINASPFEGYIGEYVYIKDAMSRNALEVLFSGFFSRYDVITPIVGATGYFGITGYEYQFVSVGGAADCQQYTISGYDSFGDPVFTADSFFSGDPIATGLVQVPMTGWITQYITGAPTGVIVVDNSYASGFGMNSIIFLREGSSWYLETFLTGMTGNINRVAQFNQTYGDFDLNGYVDQDLAYLYYNGFLITGGDYTITGNLYYSGYLLDADFFLSGRRVFANGVYESTGHMNYDVFIGTEPQTSTISNFNYLTPFSRNTSRLFVDNISGERMRLGVDYFEDSNVDLFEYNYLFDEGLSLLYDNSPYYLVTGTI